MEKNSVKLRAIFMGTSGFAARILSSLIEAGYNIVSVYTPPDRKAGRDQAEAKSPVKIAAEAKGLPVFQPKKLDDAAVSEMAKQKPDIIILAAYGKIIPKSMLKLPGFGGLNVHGSLLPRYRGPSPVQNAILNGEKETGVTIMLMDETIDTGKILNQRTVEIGPHETTGELMERMAEISAELLLETVPAWVEGKISPRQQDNSKATLCQLIEKEDGKVIWSDEAEAIYNKYRAFTPWPGIFVFWERDDSLKRIKLNKVGITKHDPESKHALGEVFQLGEKIGVQTGRGVLLVDEIQLEGKPSMAISEFLNGYPDFVGSILK